MRPVLALGSRSYTISAEPFEVLTSDGVRVRGHRLGRGPMALVLCHGFVGWHRKPRLVRFQEELSRWFTVYAFDFRGHGESGGLSSLGVREHLDVEAVVHLARRDGFDEVVTVGGSMGGIAAIRHAALVGGVGCVVAVSTPSTWTGHDSRAMRRVLWLVSTPRGRRLLRLFGIRVTSRWEFVPTPAESAALVSPTPLVIVHGKDDQFFDEQHARRLYETAEAPKVLLLASRFGHAEDGYTAAFAARVTDVAMRFLSRPDPAEGTKGLERAV